MGLHQRAEKVYSLPTEKLILINVSHVLFGTAVITALLLSVANTLGYDVLTKALLASWSILLLLASYLVYRRVKADVDFLDYVSSFIFYHRVRKRNKLLDVTNTLLFFGLLLVSLTPFIYTFLSIKGYGTGLAILSLFIGGVLIASAVSGYVLLEKT